MAEANAAYAAGDEGRLEAILRNWQSSPDAVEGDGTGAELVRTIRKIAQVEERLSQIGLEIGTLERSDLYLLSARAEAAAADGRDLLEEMAALLDGEIEKATRRLSNLESRSQS